MAPNKPKKIIPEDYNERKIVAHVDHLKLTFRNSYTGVVNNVIRDTGFQLYEGEVLALIGESGSGKSIISSTLLGLQGSTAIIEHGAVVVNGIDVTDFKERDWEKAKLRGRVISQVFQDPNSTLNPTMKIGTQLIEGALLNNQVNSRREAIEKAIALLERFRIKNAKTILKLYPHQLSGGMKQRVCIAAAILCRPKIMVFDEPTTALDPTVQAEILNIIREIKDQYNISIVFISHDLGVVGSIADRVAIMYAGQIVEYGKVDEILYYPQHPYTWGLISSMPDVNQGKRLSTIPGSVPANFTNIKGDAFAPRNEYALKIDFEKRPPYFKISDTHFAATWLLDERTPKFKLPEVIQSRWDKYFELNPDLKAKYESENLSYEGIG